MRTKYFLLGILINLSTLHGVTGYAQTDLYPSTFHLRDVRLLEGPFRHAQELNVSVLLKYDVDRLLAPFRKEAGLPSKAESFPNWLGLDGHILGHYLSAMAIHYASTGLPEFRERMEYIVAELKACQIANGIKHPDWGVGYVGGVPDGKGLWPEIMAGNTARIWDYWVPWYNVHKTFEGLKDAWYFGGSEDARKVFLKFCDWAINITSRLSDSQMEAMLGNEHGGMNEVLAHAYKMTGEDKYLVAAKRFSHKYLLNPMAEGIDMLENLHANTQIPKALGFARIAEVSGDATYKRAARFFWETVSGPRSLALGGNSRHEFFPPTESYIEYIHDVQGPESCNTHNMVKLTKNLFRIDPNAKYVDYFERALFNHILSTQHPKHGGYVYFTPARPRHYRVYSAPNSAMWCCVGTGMENHGNYAEFIFAHLDDTLFLNLFIASELNWGDKGIKVRQETEFPFEDRTRITISEGRARFTLMVRKPFWVAEGAMEVTVNGRRQRISETPSSYIAIDRRWRKGDIVEIKIPKHLRIEHLPNVPEYVAFMYGPILLGAKTGTEDLRGLIAGDGRWEHIAHGRMLPVNEAPVLIANDIKKITDKLVPVQGNPLAFSMANLNIVNADKELILQPFFQIHDARYMMYWLHLSESGYQRVLDSIASMEAVMMELAGRTVAFVQPGHQQPEADHFMEFSQSNAGIHMDQFFRYARNGGYFSYLLPTKGESDLSLIVRYWGHEPANRNFSIMIDGVLLTSENLSDKWNVGEFRDVEYKLPNDLLEGKEAIRIKFLSTERSVAGRVFGVRLVRQ